MLTFLSTTYCFWHVAFYTVFFYCCSNYFLAFLLLTHILEIRKTLPRGNAAFKVWFDYGFTSACGFYVFRYFLGHNILYCQVTHPSRNLLTLVWWSWVFPHFLVWERLFLFHFWKTALVGMAFLTVRSLLSTLWVCQPFFFWPVKSANKIMGTCLFVTSQFSFGTSMVPLVWFGFVAVVVVVLMTAAAVVVVVVLASGFW